MLTQPSLPARLRAIIGLRLIVSEQESFDINQKVIDQGCIPIFLNFMQSP